MAVLYLPDDIVASDIDQDTVLVLSPGQIEAIFQRVSRGRKGVVYALFDKVELMDVVGRNGNVEISVTGRLNDGTIYTGTETVTIAGKAQSP